MRERSEQTKKLEGIHHYGPVPADELALYLPTDSAGRSCFISPRSDNYEENSDSDCEAIMYFMYSSELLNQAQKNQRDDGT